jgi:flagellar biosynthesis chaperone FliJ
MISIDEKIDRAKVVVGRAKEKYDAAVNELEKLLTKKQELRKDELIAAAFSSSKSYEEIIAFLNSDHGALSR